MEVYSEQLTSKVVSSQPNPIDAGNRGLIVEIGDLFDFKMEANIKHIVVKMNCNMKHMKTNMDSKLGASNKDITPLRQCVFSSGKSAEKHMF